MVQSTTKIYQFTLNKLVASAFLVLVVGTTAGYGLQKLESMKSDANLAAPGRGCRAENWDVGSYAEHLAGILQGGGHITQIQMNTMIDLMEIRDECESRWAWERQMAYR